MKYKEKQGEKIMNEKTLHSYIYFVFIFGTVITKKWPFLIHNVNI